LTEPEQLITACIDKPIAFNRHVLGRVHPSLPDGYWSKQVEVLKAIRKYRKVMVPAGHAVGKGFLASGASIHFLVTNPDSRVILLGPTHSQVSTGLWPEVTAAWNRSLIPLPGRVKNGSPLQITIKDKWGLIVSSADTDAEALGGKHAGKMLVVCDEASWEGYDKIIESLEGLNASNYLFLGNPLRNNGFKRLCDQADDITSKVIRISSLESPHAHLDRSPVGMADRGYINDMRTRYGEDSPQWRVRVLGEFNEDDSFCLIPSNWMDRCLTPLTEIDHGPRCLSVDLSKGTGRGDYSVILVRDLDQILYMDWSASWSYPEGVAAKVKEVADRFKIPGDQVIYDHGGLGTGFGYNLANVGLAGAYGYVGGERGGKHATNFRGASALALKDRLDPSRNPVPFHIPRQYLDILKPQIAELRYELAGKDQIKLENKMLMKERMGRSPDHLDALIMAFARVF
jgi:hypothetical protein